MTLDNTSLLIGGGGVIAIVTLIVLFARPFSGTRRSGADHEGGGWAWIGADDRHDGGDHGSDGGGDGGAGD